MAYVATDDGGEITQDSLSAWRQSRHLFGRFVEVRLGQAGSSVGAAYPGRDGRSRRPTMVLVDHDGQELALNGVACGYAGEGPTGAARILLEEGFLQQDEVLQRVQQERDELHLRRPVSLD